MFFKKILKAANFFLLFAAVVLAIRFFLLPQFLFPQKYQAIVEKCAEKYAIEQSLVYAVIKTESNFRPLAVSVKNAKGLMQITDTTGKWGAKEIGLDNFDTESLFQPEVNIEIGCWYLSRLLVQYHYNLETALAAYNAGSGNVSKWLSSENYSEDGNTIKKIPFGETDRFVERVLRRKKIYEALY